MSICPEKDLFSVQLDGELSSPFKENFLSHLNSCESCRRQYEAYEAVHKTIAEDSQSLSLNEKQLEQGYERLLVKMKYHTVTKQRSFLQFPALKYAAAAAAAAAFIFAAAVPARKVQTEFSGLISRSSQTAPLMKNTGIVADSSIPHSVLASALGGNVSFQKNTVPVSFSENQITSMDIFKPEFSENQQSITITLDIALPPGIIIRGNGTDSRAYTVQYTGKNP